MSYKLNQQDPTRRERILARRTSKPVQARPSTKPYYGSGPMKISNRRACMRRLALRVKRKEITVKEAENLTPLILAGHADRQQVYGFYPTRS